LAEEVPGGVGVIWLLAFLAIIPDVRQAAMSGDLAGAERLAEEHRKQAGVTPEYLEAYSWIGRGALSAKKYDQAEKYAAATKKQALSMLKGRKLDDEPRLPIALGAAIEVQGQVLAAKGDRAAALEYLNEELDRYRSTSIRTRIQKNLNLVGLEGKPLPKLEGVKVAGPALLFFWAHWCGDCKAMASIVADIQQKHPNLTVVGPTQLYGYAEAGREVGPEEERQYIAKVGKEFYGAIKMPTPISNENFKVMGASTTPTLVLVDSKGIVRMYNPGRLTAAELSDRIRKVLP
jgi:thiol-disulfide isomerase/thioredoxin